MRRFILFLAASLTLIVTATNANQSHAAVLSIIYDGVEIQRAGTNAWLPLPSGAVAPVGEGDTIRTDSTGRAFIAFDEAAVVLVMPISAYTIERFEMVDDQRYIIDASSDGLSIHAVAEPESVNYRLQLNDNLAVTTPSTQFATWSSTDSPPTIITAEGTLILNDDGERITIHAAEGYRIGYDAPANIPPPLNEARLIGQVEGCPGIVDTEGGIDLSVRDGSAVDSFLMGIIPTGEMVRVLGISETGVRLRIQYLSSFGWVETLAVTHNCPDLPVFGVPYQEFYRAIINVTTEEYTHLQPFYGMIADDPYFYRFSDTSN